VTCALLMMLENKELADAYSFVRMRRVVRPQMDNRRELIKFEKLRFGRVTVKTIADFAMRRAKESVN
jgi:hypothetical protein